MKANKEYSDSFKSDYANALNDEYQKFQAVEMQKQALFIARTIGFAVIFMLLAVIACVVYLVGVGTLPVIPATLICFALVYILLYEINHIVFNLKA